MLIIITAALTQANANVTVPEIRSMNPKSTKKNTGLDCHHSLEIHQNLWTLQ
jgi:hypothetical protein